MTKSRRRQRLSRRQFLKAGALAVGAAADRATQPDVDARVVRQPRRSLDRLRTLESLRHRLEPPERARNLLRAPRLLQRVRRQGIHVARRELQVQPRLQGADDQDALGHQVERRRAVQRRRRDVHAEHAEGAGAEGPLGRGRAAIHAGGENHRAEHRRHQVQGPGAALLLLHDVQVRHRGLHRPEAHLPGTGLDDVQALRRGEGLAGHHQPVEGGVHVAAAEGRRSAQRVVGSEGRAGADAEGRAQHLAAVGG